MIEATNQKEGMNKVSISAKFLADLIEITKEFIEEDEADCSGETMKKIGKAEYIIQLIQEEITAEEN